MKVHEVSKIRILKNHLSTGYISLSEATKILKSMKLPRNEYNQTIKEFEEIIRIMLAENDDTVKIVLDRAEDE